MNIQKTSGISPADKAAVQNAAAKQPPAGTSVQAANLAPTKPATASPPWTPSSLITATGLSAALPTDKLSASIISFARFFSLPLKPELMAEIRRQSLSQSTTAQPSAAENKSSLETTAKNRETLSLAAAAAEGKGVELRQKGLELFAEAIDPDWQRRQESNEQGRRERRHKNYEQENAPQKTGPLSAAALRELATESAGQSPLLAMLNRLPGKNGQRWVVLPFSFCESGREYRVSLRVLLEPDSKMPQRAACMALDIAEIGETERNWLFVLDKANSIAPRLNVYLQPELTPQDLVSLGGELARLMEMPLEHISVKNRAESFPCEAGSKDDLLRSINEAV